MTGFAAAARDLEEEEVETRLEIEEIQAIKRVDPRLELKMGEAKSIGKGGNQTDLGEEQESVVSIPTNHGSLVITTMVKRLKLHCTSTGTTQR